TVVVSLEDPHAGLAPIWVRPELASASLERTHGLGNHIAVAAQCRAIGKRPQHVEDRDVALPLAETVVGLDLRADRRSKRSERLDAADERTAVERLHTAV